jgi:hypothetical protein
MTAKVGLCSFAVSSCRRDSEEARRDIFDFIEILINSIRWSESANESSPAEFKLVSSA